MSTYTQLCPISGYTAVYKVTKTGMNRHEQIAIVGLHIEGYPVPLILHRDGHFCPPEEAYEDAEFTHIIEDR